MGQSRHSWFCQTQSQFQSRLDRVDLYYWFSLPTHHPPRKIVKSQFWLQKWLILIYSPVIESFGLIDQNIWWTFLIWWNWYFHLIHQCVEINDLMTLIILWIFSWFCWTLSIFNINLLQQNPYIWHWWNSSPRWNCSSWWNPLSYCNSILWWNLLPCLNWLNWWSLSNC